MNLALGLAPLCCFAAAAPALAQVQPPTEVASAADDKSDPAQQQLQANPVAATADQASQPAGGGADIFSKDVITLLLDGRMVVANGERSWVNRGLGKTAFQGTRDGGYKVYAIPVEGDLIWTPRFSNSMSANISAAWQRDQEHAVD